MSEQLLTSEEVAAKVHMSSSTLRLLPVRFATCLRKFANPPKNRSGHDGKRLCTLEDVTILARARGVHDRAVPGFQGHRPEISQSVREGREDNARAAPAADTRVKAYVFTVHAPYSVYH